VLEVVSEVSLCCPARHQVKTRAHSVWVQVVDLNEILDGGIELHQFACPSVVKKDPDNVGQHCKQ
jgi:hypothetical protein